MTRPTQKIVPNLWFDDQAEEAVRLYTSLFPGAHTGRVTRYPAVGQEIHGRPAGSVMTVEFELAGFRMTAINGGPHFRFTPAISLFLTVETAAEVDHIWSVLEEGGTALMPLDVYDWSPRYGWIQDRFGLTWQVAQGSVEEAGGPVVPMLMFVTDRPVAQTAMDRYAEIFDDAGVDAIVPFPPGVPGGLDGGVMHGRFRLAGQPFLAMDASAKVHGFGFNEAVSLLVDCDSQAEIDRYWQALGTDGDPQAQQCGWLKDAFGVSWQVHPNELNEMLTDPDTARVERVTSAFLQMKKFDLAALRSAFEG